MNSPANSSQEETDKKISKRLASIHHILLILSGKGGVGKSTVAVNIATELARAGKQVGLLDVDIHGPSIPSMMGLSGSPILYSENSMLPVEFTVNLKVMSIGFLLQDRGDAVIWRGPLKYSVIQQFIADVEWGTLDYLVIDSPPGTGDEPLSIAQLTAPKATAVIVTTPQQVSIEDVRKSITFCRKVNLPVKGIIENMSGFVCPHCGNSVDIFNTGGGEALAREMNVPFLGRIPIDPVIVSSCDDGTPFILKNTESKASKAFQTVIQAFMS
ncbi:Mrp/NBP35 family ATP-binding protein [bacterium]|nr:Mrp/NBP35 family ATP-binding protein [bacterium]